MRTICSYCRCVLGERPPFDDDRISHSMCQACSDHFERQWSGLDLDGYLEGLDAPVVVVDEEGRVMGANQAMGAVLGRSAESCLGLLGGEVFECSHARLPEGCGKTTHCVACTVRRVVNATMTSGKPVENAPAYVDRDDGRFYVRLSAERVPQGVRLKVKPVPPGPTK